MQKFQLIKDVVCLNRVVRAPNALGALCTFVRHCKITDAVWTLLQSLVLRENDDRLGSAVWQKSSLKMSVQRHTLRVSMSDAAVLERADKMSSPVYLCAARDDVASRKMRLEKILAVCCRVKTSWETQAGSLLC